MKDKALNIDPRERDLFRIKLIFFIELSLLGSLLIFLWNLQGIKGKTYHDNIVRQSVRRIRLPELRGCIYDRNGICLADNRASHGIAIYIEEVRRPGPWRKTVNRIDKMIQDLSRITGIPRQVTRKEISRHVERQRYLPLLAWRDLNDAEIARFAERVQTFPGVDFYTEAYREYPYGSLACHVIGYVGRGGMPEQEEGPYDLHLPQMEGKSGIEKQKEEFLMGRAGSQLLRVDVLGYLHETISTQHPENGSDLKLTLDVDIQSLAEKTLGKEMGAICIVDPNNGNILALASYPGYDLNNWIPKISTRDFKALNEDPRKPFVNRTTGTYAPGSIFKPIVAMAGLESGKLTPSTSYFCPGYLELGNLRMHCGNRGGHGNIDLKEALERSCNVYFFRVGLDIGYDYIYYMASALGLGKSTGVPLDSDRPGILPNSYWKRKQWGEGWREGDTANISIGQGFLTSTPLQMAMVTACIANGGTLYKPRLIKAVRFKDDRLFKDFLPEISNRMDWSYRNLRTVREGMRDVIMSPGGTAYSSENMPGLVYAGKTGTAQYGRRDQKKYRAWMIAFAPYDHPRYAIAMALDEAESSSISAAPKMRKLMKGLFSKLRSAQG